MSINDFKYCFYIVLAITLTLYYIIGVLKDNTKKQVTYIFNYIQKHNVFEKGFIKTAYNEFKNSSMVKNYLENYQYLTDKKKNNEISNIEFKMLERLDKDIQLLNVSFLSTVVSDNTECFEDELCYTVNKFLKTIKQIQILNWIKFILTVLSIFMFFTIVF